MNIEFLSAAAGAEQATIPMEWSVWAWLCKSTGWSYPALTVAFVAVCIFVPYLIGSINPAIIFSKVFYHDDIRTHGSGNAGATNTLRTYGKKMSVAVFLCDVLKAAFAVGFGWLMMGHDMGGAIAGFFVIFGHMFPVYYRFKGGKGVACAAVVVLMMSPVSFLFCLIVFLIIVLGTKFVSLASVISVALYPLFIAAFPGQNRGSIGIFAVFIAGFVIFMHRGNLKRIYNGEESKISFKKKDNDTEPSRKNKNEKLSKIYKDSDFVKCNGCGHTIPVARKTCVYCGEENPAFVPSEAGRNPNKKKKK